MRACDYSIYKIVYKTTYAERVSTFGGMDSELTGKNITHEREYFCVAPTTALARAAFDRYHSKDEFIGILTIKTLDDIIIID